MDTRTRTIVLWSGVALLVVTGIVMLFLSFGGEDTPEQELSAIQTNAAITIAAQVQTLQAGMLSPTTAPALVTPTATVALLPSPTFQLQTPVLIPTSTPAVGGGATGCDNSVWVSDVTIPDGTVVTPGQTFTKTWKVSNNGTCAWTATYQLIFVSGDSMGGKATAIGKAVGPGEVVDVSVVLTAPASGAGTIRGSWRLSNDKSLPFGNIIYVEIKLSGASTSTFTPTAGAYPNP